MSYPVNQGLGLGLDLIYYKPTIQPGKYKMRSLLKFTASKIIAGTSGAGLGCGVDPEDYQHAAIRNL